LGSQKSQLQDLGRTSYKESGNCMNERIKQLVEQAFIITTDGKIGHVNNYMVEKFAELIVRECLEIAKNREDEFESAGLLEQSNAVGNVAYRISRQFGVKR
jgi:hypothetical protein